jgi:hypothetical protein
MNPKGQLDKLPRSTAGAGDSVLGMNGVTAYFGLLDVGHPVEGGTVVVSGAAGATARSLGRSRRSRAAAP